MVDVAEVAASGDVAYHRGHFHPNKAPGTSIIAVPAYALIYSVERLLGAAPDRWWVLTVNAWLVSVFSVGLVTALGTVLIFRLARTLASDLDAVFTALVFAFGTMTWPHATFLMEHNVVAVSLLAAFYCLERAHNRRRYPDATVAASNARRDVAYAGLCASYAAITNYAMAALVLVLGVYVIVRLGWGMLLRFGLAVTGPLLLLMAYNQACFGTPLTTNYAHQNPLFVSGDQVLGVFTPPKLDVLLILLFSPFRGLFFTSPVLLLGIAGW